MVKKLLLLSVMIAVVLTFLNLLLWFQCVRIVAMIATAISMLMFAFVLLVAENISKEAATEVKPAEYDFATYKKCCGIEYSAECYRDITVISLASCSDIDICVQAAENLLDISGIKASFVISGQEACSYVIARSKDDFDVQIIAEMLGGGGNKTASGARQEYTPDEAVIKLKEKIDSYFVEIY